MDSEYGATNLTLPVHSSPGRVLLFTTAGIFVSELVAMVIISRLPPLSYAVLTLIDALIMTALIFPLLYFLSFRQLLSHVARHKRNEAKLAYANRHLQELSRDEYNQRRWAEALADATGALNQSLNLNEVLSRILTQIGRVTPYDAAAVLLLEGEKVTVLRHRGFESLPEAITSYEERGFAWDAFPSLLRVRDSGEPLFVPDMDNYPLRAGMQGFEWVRSFMVAPFTHERKLVGMIILTGAERNFFDAADFTRLVSFTAHAEIAIANARSFERESRARELANVLREASTALAQSLELEVICHTSLDYVMRLVPFDRASVVLMESDERLVEYGTRRGTTVGDPMCPEKPFRPQEFPVIANLLKEQESRIIEDTRKERGWRHIAGCEAVCSWLGVPLVVGGKTIGLFSLDRMQAGSFTEGHLQLAEALAAQTAVTIQKAWLFEQVRRAGERLQSLSRRLVEIQETERNYIARELHDEAGQALAALTVDLRVIEQRVHEPQVLLARVAKMDATLQKTIVNLHRLAMALRPAALDHVGLEAAMCQHVEEVADRHGLNIQFACVGMLRHMPKDMEMILYRILQEALTNIVRHAQARNVDVLLKQRDSGLALVIEDDGVGFDAFEALAGERLGLLGMRERTEMLGGQLTIESSPGKGASILVEIPYGYSDSDR